MSLKNASLRRALAFASAALILLPASAAGRTLVGTPGKDRLRGGDNGNVINGDGGGDKLLRRRRRRPPARRVGR